MKKIETSKGVRYQLDPAERTDLIVCAQNVIVNTYPISDDGYATALMTVSGSIYEGISYKSETHTLTMHAEVTALANAAIHGETDVVAIVGPNCHICKQLIYENGLNSGIDIMIIMDEENGPHDVPISEMMPYAWPLLKGKSES